MASCRLILVERYLKRRWRPSHDRWPSIPTNKARDNAYRRGWHNRVCYEDQKQEKNILLSIRSSEWLFEYPHHYRWHSSDWLGTAHLVRYREPGPDITGGHREVQGLGTTEERYCSWRKTTLWPFGNLEGVSSRGALCSNWLWHKFKEPQDWPVNDRARKRPFPSNVKDLEELAEHLSTDMASIPDTFFDNVIRKEYIYLLVQISDDLSSRTPISTSASSFHHNILSEGTYELVKQNCLAWCGVPSQSRLFQVDVGRYKTRSVNALRDEVLRQSGFRDPECNLWKVRLQEA